MSWFKRLPAPVRWLLETAAAIVALIVSLIVLLLIIQQVASWHDKQSINAAVKDIKLPAEYHLVSSKYDDQFCIDVCAHTLLTYKSTAGNLNLGHVNDMVNDELKRIGYHFDGTYYSKTYKGKSVHVTQTSDWPNVVRLDVSL